MKKMILPLALAAMTAAACNCCDNCECNCVCDENGQCTCTCDENSDCCTDKKCC